MINNLYWSVYKNIEREVIHLSNEIHFDDNQLNVYSIKISELLIRTVVEVESIAKDLYFINGGNKPTNENELFFDTDCINLLEQKWLLSKKKVLVSSPNLYFQKDENKILTPLRKANKRGTSSSDWLRAYQAVKHNRAKNLHKGNIKHLIRALAGLYVLNIYYKDIEYDLEKDANGTNFDTNIGSKLFSVKLHINNTINLNNIYSKNEDFNECIYLLNPTLETRKGVIDSLQTVDKEIKQKYIDTLPNVIQQRLSQIKNIEEKDLVNKIEEITKNYELECLTNLTIEQKISIKNAYGKLRYEAKLNKQQH